MAPIATEKTPLAMAEAPSSNFVAVMKTIVLGTGYIVISSSLIQYNKSLMTGAFPFSVALVVIHSIFSSLCSALLFLFVPSAFPSLTSAARISLDFNLIVKSAMPIALCFSITLVLSNSAYVHSDVAFLQMMKEANVVGVYFLSVLFALEVFSWRSVCVLVFIIFATSMSIKGALEFSLAGFLIQTASQIAECSKIALQALVLSSAGKKLDVMTYTLLVMPLCVCFLVVALSVLAFMPLNADSSFNIPTLSQVHTALPVLIPNALLAFSLNIVAAMFMKCSSGVAYVLAGILKDVMIVVASVALAGEEVSHIQTVSFSLQVLGIYVWAMMKMFPEPFEDGFVFGLMYALFGYRRQPAAGEAVMSAPETQVGKMA
jgi:hypothetical protein